MTGDFIRREDTKMHRQKVARLVGRSSETGNTEECRHEQRLEEAGRTLPWSPQRERGPDRTSTSGRLASRKL